MKKYRIKHKILLNQSEVARQMQMIGEAVTPKNIDKVDEGVTIVPSKSDNDFSNYVQIEIAKGYRIVGVTLERIRKIREVK